jgi:glycosyltransferase involved in cell wall biosynthesis
MDMPKISALLHTHDDALRLGRALESLRPCDEVLVIDDCSEDDTAQVARQYGAIVKNAIPGVTFGAYAMDTTHHWVLCLRPNEALSEDLEASLLEWKTEEPHDGVACYGISIREQNGHGWRRCPPEVRLVNRGLMNWVGEMPSHEQCEMMLSGDLLCFHQP